MNEQTSAFSVEDRKILRQLFAVIGLFVVSSIVGAVVINVIM